jgi:exodeoxyribonuclease V alpha subunit
MIPSIELLRDRVLSPLDLHFARALGRMGGDERRETLLAAALVSRFVRNGHVCLDLPRFVAAPDLVDDGGEMLEMEWLDADRWLDGLRNSPLVSGDDNDEERPLVLDHRGRLYLRRYWEHQGAVVKAIRDRVMVSDSSIDAAWLRPALDRLFPSVASAGGEPDWQRVAAAVALLRSFCVISGGPGTGKTFTVVKILALVMEHAIRRGRRPPRVALMAPTGKAAARLSESIRRAKVGLPVDDAILDLIPEDASTIHRSLGSFRGSATAVRHDRGNPLLADVVLVDEASMIDLALLRRLLDAVAPRAGVVLLGDKDQLASVEAGAVLGDICNSGERVEYSTGWTELLCNLTGEPLSPSSQAASTTGIGDCIVQLRRSYRSASAPAIGELANAINTGDADATLRLLDSSDVPYVDLHEPGPKNALSPALRRQVIEGFGTYLRLDSPAAQLRELDHFRVLCAHRRGLRGVEAINPLVEEALADKGLIDLKTTAYLGRPVLVVENDYQLNLFNGDVGVIGREAAAGDLRLVYFDAGAGRERKLSPSRLPPHETAYAMSVHKSQGSELDRVAVVLPDAVSPVLSRELLYTAVTRAREAVSLHATRQIIRETVSRRVERASGLREALWGGE